MTPTCDLHDHFLDAAGVLPPALRHFGARRAFLGPAVTVIAAGNGRAGAIFCGAVREIEGVRISPGDRIVADADGVLVIPQGLPLPG